MTQGRGQVIHADELTHYDFGGAGGHPMGGPNRVKWAIELARELGVMDQLDVIPPPPADDDLVRLVHTDDYIEAVKAELPNPPRYGLGTEDNPIFHGMHHVASQVVTATVAAARQVWTGQTKRVANISGGLHHAMPAATSGFCVYNDIAVAIRWLQREGAGRIVYLDVDAHHATASRRSSTTTRTCSPSACTSRRSTCSRAPGTPRRPAPRTRAAAR